MDALEDLRVRLWFDLAGFGSGRGVGLRVAAGLALGAVLGVLGVYRLALFALEMGHAAGAELVAGIAKGVLVLFWSVAVSL